MTKSVLKAFSALNDELLIAMAQDNTSLPDAIIYGGLANAVQDLQHQYGQYFGNKKAASGTGTPESGKRNKM